MADVACALYGSEQYLRGRSLQMQWTLVAGLGVALLPCVAGELRPGWRRVRLVPEVRAPL